MKTRWAMMRFRVFPVPVLLAVRRSRMQTQEVHFQNPRVAGNALWKGEVAGRTLLTPSHHLGAPSPPMGPSPVQ